MKKRKLNYFDVKYALEAHRVALLSGGLDGVKDIGYVESILFHIQNDKYYREFEDKLTHLVFSFIKNHAFYDGNKRTSITLGAFFLSINGVDEITQKFFIREMENIVVWVAENKISKSLLKELLSYIIMRQNYPEELKLNLVKAIDKQ